ncbi:MAG: TerC family protein [candidate division NC10 bacterium]|nr:TerC family protein [candidate division NC10 bacterium]
MGVEFYFRWLSIVLIDLSLAGDNALVIGMAVRTLPRRQKRLGIFFGTLGAIALRVTFTFIIAQLLMIPLLQALGGLILVWIALRLLRQNPGGEGKVREGTTLAEAIRIIILADIIMSLDNMLAIAAASHGNLFLLIFGLGLSIPILMVGAAFISWLMNKYPWLVLLGGAILGWVAGEMLVKDRIVHGWVAPYAGFLKWFAPAFLALAVVAIGLWWASRIRRSSEQSALAPHKEH